MNCEASLSASKLYSWQKPIAGYRRLLTLEITADTGDVYKPWFVEEQSPTIKPPASAMSLL